MKRNPNLALEQIVLRGLRHLDRPPRSILVGCSGGVDSMVLLEILWRLRNALGFRLSVAHVHHGGEKNSRYRRKAWALVSERADELNLPFFTNSPDGKHLLGGEPSGESEAELRSFRWDHLSKWRKESGCDVIAVAHHYHDLLETRLMRLIRGTGASGFSSMGFLDSRRRILRPLLMVEKPQVLHYAVSRKTRFIDDPTNRQTDAFRNWIRRWLSGLEKRHPGGVRNLARSLSDLAEKLEQAPKLEQEAILTDGGINRRRYIAAGLAGKKSSLAHYCFELGLRNYTQGHIEELVKRLDVRRKHFTFELLQCVWCVTPERIKVERFSSKEIGSDAGRV